MKGKARNFSIFLLKVGVTVATALKEEHSLEEVVDAENLPVGGSLYVSDRAPMPPWWRIYWGIKLELKQSLKGAIAFIPVGDRIVALTFGHTYHNLRDGCYEYDFGIRTTLNALDPDKIKSTDILVPESALRERIQSPTAADLTIFDFDRDESIVKRLTGAVKEEYREYFRNVTGSSSLKICARVSASEISSLCERLLEVYRKDDFKRTFPDLQNIVPVSDPHILSVLDAELLAAFSHYKNELVLSVPAIVDHGESFRVAYSGAGRSSHRHDDVYIDHYRQYLAERGVGASIEGLKSHRLDIRDENDVLKESYSIYKGLLFDCALDGGHYHLCEGEWYKIEKSYIQRLRNQLDPLFGNHESLIPCEVRREDEYNGIVAASARDAVCLDKQNISPSGQSAVEPCDVFFIRDGRHQLVHIKVSTRSSSLSHLFNQGVNSAQLLRMSEEAVGKFNDLLAAGGCVSELDVGKIEVVYGIITAKDRSKRSDSLPIFSRISLVRAMKALRLMGVSGRVVLVEDKFDRKDSEDS